jgi:hypothetical protein
VTAEDIIYHRRVYGYRTTPPRSVSPLLSGFRDLRTTYYRWENRARRYDLSVLLPKARRNRSCRKR